jgi:predicted GTPase
VLVVFDITTGNSTFNDDAPYWIDQARRFAGNTIPVLLVANKVDSVVGKDARERGLTLHNVDESVQAHSYAGNIYYVSAKSGVGTDDIERDLCHILEMTERYSEIASDLAVSGIHARQNHARGIITGNAFNGGDAAATTTTQPDALLNVVNGADGVPRVVKAPQFVKLVGGDPKKEPGNLLTPGSSASRAPISGSRQESGFDVCAC